VRAEHNFSKGEEDKEGEQDDKPIMSATDCTSNSVAKFTPLLASKGKETATLLYDSVCCRGVRVVSS